MPIARRIDTGSRLAITVLNSAGKADAVNKHREKLGRPLPKYYTKGRAA